MSILSSAGSIVFSKPEKSIIAMFPCVVLCESPDTLYWIQFAMIFWDEDAPMAASSYHRFYFGVFVLKSCISFNIFLMSSAFNPLQRRHLSPPIPYAFLWGCHFDQPFFVRFHSKLCCAFWADFLLDLRSCDWH